VDDPADAVTMPLMPGRVVNLLDLGAALALTAAVVIGFSYLGWRAALCAGLLTAGALTLWATRTLTRRSRP